jgi:glycine/D-amino acid oxidase-like deaminating enzyme
LGYDDDIPVFSPPSGAAENLTCQLLIAGGGLSGLSAAEAAMRQGVDVIVIEKGVFGEQTASALNAGQFLTGWAKPVDTMLIELAQQERERGLRGEQAQLQAQRRVRTFLRRTVEGCQRLSALDREYNLEAFGVVPSANSMPIFG